MTNVNIKPQPAIDTRVSSQKTDAPARVSWWTRRRILILLGPFVMLAVWYLLGLYLTFDARLTIFSAMGLTHALPELLRIMHDGTLWSHSWASLLRIAEGLFYAMLFGCGLGVINGMSLTSRYLTHIPFQLLRMVSPLSWMPIAVMVFVTWHNAIVFIITMAAIWPIYYAISNAIARLNPDWFAFATSLRASRYATWRYFIIPAVVPDMLSGLRLALGVAWIVLVPAELLGVTAGLGYAINDARDALAYDQLAAIILAIGLIGLILDSTMGALSHRFAWKQDG